MISLILPIDYECSQLTVETQLLSSYNFKLNRRKVRRQILRECSPFLSLFCAFQPDHCDNELHTRTWHLCKLVFIKGRSPASLVRCFPLFALWDPLTYTDPCRRRKWNCMKLQAMKKSNRNGSYFLLSSWASSLKGFWNLTLLPMFQGNLIVQDHSVRIFCFFCFTVKSKSILLPTPRRAGFVSFLR